MGRVQSEPSWSSGSSGRDLTSVHVTQTKALRETESQAAKQSKGLRSRPFPEGVFEMQKGRYIAKGLREGVRG